MTITSEDNRTEEQTTDGIETEFDFDMLIHADTEVQVWYEVTDGEYIQLALDTNYTVIFTDDGGTVTTIGPDSPYAAGKILIIRHIALTQVTNWLYNDNHTGPQHMHDFDRSAMRDLQLQDTLDRVVTLAIHSSTTGIILPEPEANELLGWNAAGTNLANISTAALVILIADELDLDDFVAELTDLTDVTIAGPVAGHVLRYDGGQWANYADSNYLPAQTIGIADDNLLEVDGTPNSGEYARFTADGLEGRTEVEFKGDFNLEIGTDVQAWDAQLDDIAVLAVTNGNFIVGDGSNWVAESGNTARTSLGLGTGDSPTFAGGIFTGVVQATDFAKTGWPITPGVTLSFDNASKVFTVTDGGSAYYYIDGVKYVLGGNKTVDLDDVAGGAVEGLWYIYFVGDTLTASQTIWSFRAEDKALVAYLYWDATNNKEIYLGYELHDFHMSGSTHARLHYAGGARWETGLLVSDNLDETVDVSNGDFWDEDLNIPITNGASGGLFEQVLQPAQLPVYYRDGASNWRIFETGEKANATDAGYTNGGDLKYNKLNGTWAAANVSGANHVAYWVIVTDDQTAPVALIMGQREDTTIANARENNIFSGLSLTGLPFEELVLLARLILKETGGGLFYTLEEVLDLRAQSLAGNITSPLITQHGGLGGLAWSDAGHTFDIAVDFNAQNLTNIGTIASGNIGVGVSPTSEDGIKVENTRTTTYKGIYAADTHIPAAPYTAAGGLRFDLTIDPGGVENANNITNVSGATGNVIIPTNSGYIGTTGSMIGVGAALSLQGNGIAVAGGVDPTITECHIFRGVANLNAGAFKLNITNLYGLKLSMTGAAAQTGSLYGIHLGAMSGAATANWAIYSEGGDSFFTDDIAFGQTDKAERIGSDADGTLDLYAGTSIDLHANTNITGTVASGAITSSGASTFNSGSVDADFAVNWNTGTGLFVEGSSGRVGIGTTTPGYILDIDAGEIGDNNYNGLRIVDTGWDMVSHPMLEFYNSHASFNGSLARIYGEIGILGENSKLYFAVADSSKSLQDRMVIDKGGNVGIGLTTVDANYKLIVRRAADVNLGIGLQSSELAIAAFNDALSANIPLRFYASEYNLLNGPVGINTTTPLSKLSINGGLHVGGDSDAGDNNLLVDGTIASGPHTITTTGTTLGIDIDGVTAARILMTNETNGGGNPTGAVIFQVGDAATRIFYTAATPFELRTSALVDIYGNTPGNSDILRWTCDGTGNVVGVGTLTGHTTITATDLVANDDVTVGENVVHQGDADTYLAFGIDQITLYAGGYPSFIAVVDKGAPEIGFFSQTQAQQAHIIDADGTLAQLEVKFNTLLADLEGYGLLAAA